MRVVIDTNVIISSLSQRSKSHWIIRAFEEEKFTLCISTDIVLEYEEKVRLKYSPLASDAFLRSLNDLPNVFKTEKYFFWHLLRDIDADDDKFVDVAIASSCDYLVTEDRDFDILRQLSFPKIRVVNIEEFKKITEQFH